MARFIKDFDYSNELLKIKTKKFNKGEDVKEKFVRNAIYGLIGEERVAYQLRISNKDILCFHNIRLKDNKEKIQIDFIVLSKNYVLLIEVKNLFGNIVVHKDNSVDRVIYKKTGREVTGMDNPLIQIENHVQFMDKFLKKHSYTKIVKGILVMANDKTCIINNSNMHNIIKYDMLNEYINRIVKDSKLCNDDYDLARLINDSDIPFSFKNFNKIGYSMLNSYTPKFEKQKDFDLYVELLKIRKQVSEKRHIPFPYIFNNKEAEKLVMAKPLNKEEFFAIPGFKEKRYIMFGEDVINLFKKS